MIDFLKQIGISILMLICVLIAVLVIAIVWLSVLVYSVIEWVVKYDGGRNKNVVTMSNDSYKDSVSPTFFSNPSLPSANVVKAKTPRHNLRGANGRFVKRITTPIEVEPLTTPVTRYGVPTHIRFANNG